MKKIVLGICATLLVAIAVGFDTNSAKENTISSQKKACSPCVCIAHCACPKGCE